MTDLNRRGFLGGVAALAVPGTITAAVIAPVPEPIIDPAAAARVAAYAQSRGNLTIQLLDGILQSAQAVAKDFIEDHLEEECSCRYCRRKDEDDRYWLKKDMAAIEYSSESGSSHLFSVMSGERYEIEAGDSFADHLRRLADLADQITALEG